jgi:hypothetical protein
VASKQNEHGMLVRSYWNARDMSEILCYLLYFIYPSSLKTKPQRFGNWLHTLVQVERLRRGPYSGGQKYGQVFQGTPTE